MKKRRKKYWSPTWVNRNPDWTSALSGFSDTVYKTETASCSCRGENSNCYKCSGTGYYEKKVAPGAVSTQVSANARPLAGFSSDSRGGIYGIREQGRFDSRPSYDKSDDDSEI